MTEMLLNDMQEAEKRVTEAEPAPLRYVDITGDAKTSLAQANKDWCLALSAY